MSMKSEERNIYVVECAAPRGMKGVNLLVHCSTVCIRTGSILFFPAQAEPGP